MFYYNDAREQLDGVSENNVRWCNTKLEKMKELAKAYKSETSTVKKQRLLQGMGIEDTVFFRLVYRMIQEGNSFIDVRYTNEYYGDADLLTKVLNDNDICWFTYSNSGKDSMSMLDKIIFCGHRVADRCKICGANGELVSALLMQ